MDTIHVLDKDTINKIAAGEVVDRPASVVKELCENAIDAGATSVSVEIIDGGIKMIRISDNGKGIDAGEVKKAFLRHSTSKISGADDLHFIRTLGFRGEALSSIAAVSRLELYTKTRDALTGTIYKLAGGEEICMEEAGLPDGTTILVNDLFFNTPARLKFLKTAKTEAGYITDMIEKMALSHPEVSFKLTVNHSTKLSTSGNGKLKDAIYSIYGRDIASHLLEANAEDQLLSVSGFIADPSVARGNRNYEIYFINGRYIKDKVIERAIEEAYKGFQMKGTFPFTVLHIHMEPELIDVNVHPSKMEIRFYDNEQVFHSVESILSKIIYEHENIPVVSPVKETPSKPQATIPESVPEPFETNRILDFVQTYTDQSKPAVPKFEEANYYDFSARKKASSSNTTEFATNDSPAGNLPFPAVSEEPVIAEEPAVSKKPAVLEQETLFHDRFLSEKARSRHRIVGEVFNTYWIVEYEDQIYIIDQHAAHEKVMYEDLIEKINNGTHYSQQVIPALILELDHNRETALLKYMEQFSALGFVIEPFGEKDYAISSLPMDLYGLNDATSFSLMLDELADIRGSFSPDILLDKVATASCKAAVKGGNRLSLREADELIDKLLKLDNPYNCPHGRPTIITMSKSELERKFKRLV